MLRPYRCYNRACATSGQPSEFWSERPICPTCEANGEERADVVVALEIIHFHPPHPRIKTSTVCTHNGTGFRACAPTIPIGRGKGTVNPHMANCPKCRQTTAFTKALSDWEEGEMVSEHDFEFAVKKNADGDHVIVKV